MGGSCSAATTNQEEEEEEYKIPPGQTWRHERCTVRALHQLSILPKERYCDYCRIVEHVRRKTIYHCAACKLNFCFDRKRNHFRKWHSAACDHFRMYT